MTTKILHARPVISQFVRPLGLACFCVAVAACSEPAALPGSAATERAVMDADIAFSQMAQDVGAPAAFLAYMDDTDGKLFRPGEIITGSEGVAADFETWPDNARLVWAPLGAHGSAFGDLGVTWGEYDVLMDGNQVSSGHYVTAWRKNPEGEWKGVIDLGVEAPPPEPAPASE